jgi:hypothetical protein
MNCVFFSSTLSEDDTTSQGKGKIRESSDSEFAKAIEALTYQAPVTRAAVTGKK